jgi:hypothetical protein
MNWRAIGLLVTVFSGVFSGAARAQDVAARAILDKAIKAIGGEERLNKISSFSWTSTSVAKTGGKPIEMSAVFTFDGLTRVRREFRIGAVPRLTILDRDKGWYAFRREYSQMDGDAVAKEKRNIYLQVVPSLLVPLKRDGFKYVATGQEEVDGKPASVLNVTGPDGKEFLLYFDKESSLPVREVARSISDDGKQHVETATFRRYQAFGGIKQATAIEVRRGPQDVTFIEITDFRVLDRVNSELFARPN